MSATPIRRPRNPLVAPSLRRKAGPHRPTQGAQRRRDKQTLQRDLRREKPHGD